ncbi:bifunctional phosphatase PAP2/diacylglycerol kinase family protein [Nocardia sp. CA-107356]|uniref:bifunctional phosphatase PAP2/diacylglycerol kinase family protein n=1 Tax=Nocardia sp. CA-107356 TaxID=3239972 RepID=UPI003D91AE8C
MRQRIPNPSRRKLAGRVDAWLVARTARVRPTPADRFLRTLSRSANYNRLWLVMAAMLALGGGRGPRRAALRGLVSVALAGSVANGVAKPLFPRRRPPDESVPFVRRLVTPPVSSSFPSGHAASAAAFVTGVALESPATAVAIAPIAAAVGYSRVHIGVHWPSDVLAGAALGSAIALGTRRWWARREDVPAELGQLRQIAPVSNGSGLLLVTNAQSGGSGADQLRSLRERLTAAEIVEVNDDLAAQLDHRASRDDVVALGVFGGDGTVSAVAAAAIEHGLPLAVFAGGTLNHFARDTGVERLEHTLTALESGEAVQTDTALVRSDGLAPRTFVNTASLGGYPDFVRTRERWEPRLGKWPAAGIAMVTALSRAQPLPATIDGVDTAIWMLFVGNGHYRPTDQVPMARPLLHQGTLDVRYLRADVPFSRIRLIWATLTGTLDRSATYVHRRAERLTVHIDSGPVALATDGEVDSSGTDFAFTSRPATLTLFRPADPH